MSPEAKWLQSQGWYTWYNENYWVHPESVSDPFQQDYTNYGMNLEDAVAYELLGKPKHKAMGLPGLSQLEMALATAGLTKKRDVE